MRQTATISHPYVALERAFAFAGLVAALGTAGGGWLARSGYGWRGMLAATSLSLLACAVAGIWAQDMMARFQRGELARVYATAMQGVRDRNVERRAGQATRLEVLALAFAGLVESTRLALFRGDALPRWGADMRRAIEARLRESESLAASLGEDAHLIATAAAGSQHAEAHMVARFNELRDRAMGAASATAALVDEADALARAIRAVTGQTERATAIATRLSETAFATQRGVARISDSTIGMIEAAGEVERTLQRATTLAAQESATGTAAEIKSLAVAGGAALQAMLDHVNTLKTQAGEMGRRVQDMSDAIQAQHEFGHALSHAAMLQGDAVGRLISQLSQAQGEMDGMTAEMRDLRLPDTRLGAGAAAQQAVERLPGYAEAMAQILRGLPDYTQESPHSWHRHPHTPANS